MTELAFRSATQLAQDLRRGELSAVQLLEHYLSRIDRWDGQTRAVVARCTEAARGRAQQADEARTRGELWGPLHGVPITVKESFDVPGLVTTFGLPGFRDNVASRYAVAVQRLVDAGAIVFGKTNVPSALADWQTFNPIYGTTHNPWDLTRGPGGSSGGSAAALAAGYTALELGSDIGASIRNPAHYCGVYGHKPTWGVVPLVGHELPGEVCVDDLDIAVAGPLARSACDLTLAMDLLTIDQTHFGPLGRTPLRWRDEGRPACLLKVAVISDDACAPVDAAVKDQLQALAEFLRGRGVKVSETVRPVVSEETWEVYAHLLRAATGARLSDDDYAAALQQREHWPRDSREYGAWHWRGSTLTHRQWVQYDKRRARLREQWAAFFEQWDLLICPVAPTPAFPHLQTGYRWERMIDVNGQAQPTTTGLFWAGYPGLCGLPATAIPLGLSPSGLPVGAQIIGPVFGDPVCLRMARWLEQDYHAFVPPPAFAGPACGA